MKKKCLLNLNASKVSLQYDKFVNKLMTLLLNVKTKRMPQKHPFFNFAEILLLIHIIYKL